MARDARRGLVEVGSIRIRLEFKFKIGIRGGAPSS